MLAHICHTTYKYESTRCDHAWDGLIFVKLLFKFLVVYVYCHL